MKLKMNAWCLGAVSYVAMVGGALASPIGVYVDDSFNGSTLDAQVWNSAGTVSVGQGSVLINANGGQFSYINSIAAVRPDAGQTVILQGFGLSSVPYSDGLGFGLYDLNNENFIMINELNTGNLRLDMKANNGAVLSSAEFHPGGFQGDLSLSWSSSQVVITLNSTVVFDSAVNGPAGGGAWILPTAPLSATAFSYVNSNTISLESVRLEVVPEPATVAMLALGGGSVLLFRRVRNA